MAKGRKVRASRAAQGQVEFSHFPPAVHFDLIRKQAVVIPALRSEERFSRNAETDIVCRLLLEKKIKIGLCVWHRLHLRRRHDSSILTPGTEINAGRSDVQ